MYNYYMTKSQAVSLWKKGALEALDTAIKLFQLKKNDHSLFFIHLAIEKILKALYISYKKGAPSYTHNLTRLAQEAGLTLDEKSKNQLDEISGFNISARYGDYKLQLYKKANKIYTARWIKVGKGLFTEYLCKL